MRHLVATAIVSLALPAFAAAKGEPLTGRVCGASACRPVASASAWRLVPWYGFGVAAPETQPFYTLELRTGGRLDGRVVWVPSAGLVWTDARPDAPAAWTRPAAYLRAELERQTRGLRPFPPAADWRPRAGRAPVTIVKACGPRGCRGVGRAGDAGRRAREQVVSASRLATPTGPWFRVVVRQKGVNGFVWSLRYAPAHRAVLVDRMDAAPPFWVSVPAALLPALGEATRALAPYPGR